MNHASSATSGDSRPMNQPSSRFMKYKRRAHWPATTLLTIFGFLSHCFGRVNTTTVECEPNSSSGLPTVSGAADLSDKGLPADPSAGSAGDPQKSANGQNDSADIRSGNFFQRTQPVLFTRLEWDKRYNNCPVEARPSGSVKFASVSIL